MNRTSARVALLASEGVSRVFVSHAVHANVRLLDLHFQVSRERLVIELFVFHGVPLG